MDQETSTCKGDVGSLSQVNEGTCENTINMTGTSSNPKNVVLENVVVLNSGDIVSDQGESGVLNTDTNGLVSSKRVKNQATIDTQGIGKLLKEGTSGNSSNLVDMVVLESVIVINSNDRACLSGGSKDSEARIDEFRLDDRVTNQGSQGNYQIFDEGNYGDSSNSVHGIAPETVIVVNSEDMGVGGRGNGELEVKGNESGSSKVTVDKSKTKAPKGEKQLCVVGVKCSGGGGVVGGGGLKDSWDGERVCRICHLSSDGSMETISVATPGAVPTTSTDLIQLGCGCKDELGIAHTHCAEAWFRLKGNRMCEICGQTAMNVTGVADSRFMEEWNERRLMGGSSDRGSGCWRGQPVCNFIMACLVIAFVFPWFFRETMF